MTSVPPRDGGQDPYGLSPAARALAARCEPRVDELARRLSRGSLREAPGYPELTGEARDFETSATARYGIRLALRRGAEPRRRAGDHGLFRQHAARRAEEGMPLHLLLRSHATGVYALWEALRKTAEPGEEEALIELAGFLLRTQQGIIGAVAETYFDEQAALAAEEREQRRALVRGLLDGSTPPDDAALAALGLDRDALVLCWRIARAPKEGAANVRRARATSASFVAQRRRRRRVQTLLDHAFGTEVLTLFDGDGGHALVPGWAGAEGPPGELAGQLRRAFGADLRLAAVRAERPAAIADAARTAAEVIRVARAGGQPPGLHRIEDVLLEFHLSRRDESSGMIAALLDPIGDRPELIETLRVHLEHQQDRRGTARLLGLHPNTVDNRLARIAELTGLDLAAPRGAALALAALLLRRVDAAP